MAEETQATNEQPGFFKRFIKRLSWEDWALILVIIAVAIVQISIFSQFKHIPGPVYGGDLYRERGYTEHILRGNGFWTDPLFLGEYNYFPWLGHLSMAFLAKITALSTEQVNIYFPVLILILISISIYMLGKKIFSSKLYALLFVMFNIILVPIEGKATAGLARISTVLFLFFWLKCEENDGWKNAILSGFFLGLAALSHGSIFITAVVLLMSAIFFEFLWRLRKSEFKILSFFKKYLILLISAILVSLFFYAPLIIKYQLKTLNPSYAYALIDVSKLGIFWGFLQGVHVFFNFSSIWLFVAGIITFLGFIYLFLDINNPKCRYIIYFFFGTLIAASHYLITKPILNKWMEPGHVLGSMWLISSIMFIFGIKLLSIILKKITKKNMSMILSLGILALLLIPLFFISINNYNKDRWVTYAKETDSATQLIFDVGDWIKKNANKNDVFLSNDESAFALNAVSGAKVVMSRRVHASYFVDIDKRYADGMVMLYGKNKSVVKNLIKEYNVKYLYMDAYLAQMSMITGTKFKEYLKKNGINFTTEEVRLDPSTLNAPTTEALVVGPQNLTILEIAKPIKEFQINGGNAVIIFKID